VVEYKKNFSVFILVNVCFLSPLKHLDLADIDRTSNRGHTLRSEHGPVTQQGKTIDGGS